MMKIKKASLVLFAAFVLVFASCTSDDVSDLTMTPPSETEPEPEPEPEFQLTLDSLIGVWDAQGYRWDLEEGASSCYLMTDDGKDFAYDDEGNYITISVKAYCEQYATDYNADPTNEMTGTPEDFANHSYENTSLFTTIEVTADTLKVYIGQSVAGQGNLSVLTVKGSYTFDPEQATFTVNDVAIASDPRELEINVFKDDLGRMNFRYSDYDIFTTYSYDQTENYWVYAPMIFYCTQSEESTTTSRQIINKKEAVFMPFSRE